MVAAGLLACATTRGPGGGGVGTRTIKAATAGAVRLVPQLVVDSVDEAASFYTRAFNAQGDPLTIGDSALSLVRQDLARDRRTPKALAATVASLDIYVTVADESFHRARKVGARPTFLVEHRFWGDRYGQVTDPSGHSWGLASRMETLSSAELAKRARKAFDGAQHRLVPTSPSSISPVPAEHKNIVIHLTVASVNEAASYYEKAFAARLLGMLVGPYGKTIQAKMMFGETMVLLDKELPQMKLLSPKAAGGTSMILIVHSKAESKQREFVDPFGHHWRLGR